MLPGDKPEPGGEIASSFEDVHRRREGLDRQGRDRADARHRLQTPCRFWACRLRTTRGGEPCYSARAITTALTLRAVFRLALRQTEGLIGSIIGLLGLALPVPDHTPLSR